MGTKFWPEISKVTSMQVCACAKFWSCKKKIERKCVKTTTIFLFCFKGKKCHLKSGTNDDAKSILVKMLFKFKLGLGLELTSELESRSGLKLEYIF